MKCIAGIASSTDSGDQEKQLALLKSDYPTEPVNYFLDQWWADGQRERWAEIYIRKNVNLGINTTSRVEGSHGAMKRDLTSSSGTLYTAGNKINVRGKARSDQLSILSSNRNLIVRLDIRNQPETSKQLRQGDESNNECSCATWNRYLLPCSHRIQLGVPIDVTDIHPRWRVHAVFPPLNLPWQQLDLDRLSVLKDPSVDLPRKGRPRGTRRLKTSAEVAQHVADQVAKVRRCGTCHEAGHNKRKCPKVLNRQSQPVSESENIADEIEEESLEDNEGILDENDDENDVDFEAMWGDIRALM
ncbi:uncharacterized protein V1513DRAFT_460991 [Lipomyces chichibuensis]|uniref:uncharacterized protein n=1 Tax=Lipomyces chichibuensis TaxID=1546026 RepID=UPI0033439B44